MPATVPSEVRVTMAFAELNASYMPRARWAAPGPEARHIPGLPLVLLYAVAISAAHFSSLTVTMRIPKRIAARVKGAWEPTAIPKIYSTPAALSVRAKASPPVIFAIVEPPLPCVERLARHGLRVLTSIALTFDRLSKRWKALWRGRRSYPLYHWAWGLGAWPRKNQSVGRCRPIDPQGLGVLQCLPIRGRPCLQGGDVI